MGVLVSEQHLSTSHWIWCAFNHSWVHFTAVKENTQAMLEVMGGTRQGESMGECETSVSPWMSQLSPLSTCSWLLFLAPFCPTAYVVSAKGCFVSGVFCGVLLRGQTDWGVSISSRFYSQHVKSTKTAFVSKISAIFCSFFSASENISHRHRTVTGAVILNETFFSSTWGLLSVLRFCTKLPKAGIVSLQNKRQTIYNHLNRWGKKGTWPDSTPTHEKDEL